MVDAKVLAPHRLAENVPIGRFPGGSLLLFAIQLSSARFGWEPVSLRLANSTRVSPCGRLECERGQGTACAARLCGLSTALRCRGFAAVRPLDSVGVWWGENI